MGLRSEWRTCKAALEAAGLGTGVFTQDLSSALRAFEDARDALEAERTKTRRDPARIASRKAALNAACNALAPIAQQYWATAHYLQTRGDTAAGQAAAKGAADFLMRVVNEIHMIRQRG